jgi:hypothetical protein
MSYRFRLIIAMIDRLDRLQSWSRQTHGIAVALAGRQD